MCVDKSVRTEEIVVLVLVYPVPSPEIGRSRLPSLCIVQPPNARRHPTSEHRFHNMHGIPYLSLILYIPQLASPPPPHPHYHDSASTGTCIFSASILNSAAFRLRSYRAVVSPLHIVPSKRSQNVKKGCEKFVLMPQLWW